MIDDMSRLESIHLPEDARTQFAALCWRVNHDRREVLLSTSRDTGRWVMPKGWPMDGRSASEAAAIEAWEEAGVEGSVGTAPVGVYSYDKTMPRKDPLSCLVEGYPLQVDRMAANYPEKNQRRRKWFSLRKAAAKVNEPELRSLILDFAGVAAADAAEVAAEDAGTDGAGTDRAGD